MKCFVSNYTVNTAVIRVKVDQKVLTHVFDTHTHRCTENLTEGVRRLEYNIQYHNNKGVESVFIANAIICYLESMIKKTVLKISKAYGILFENFKQCFTVNRV